MFKQGDQVVVRFNKNWLELGEFVDHFDLYHGKVYLKSFDYSEDNRPHILPLANMEYADPKLIHKGRVNER